MSLFTIAEQPATLSSLMPLIYFRTISQAMTFHAGGVNLILGTTTPAINTWHHVAVARSGTSTKLFLNGVQEGATFTGDTNNYIVGASRPMIGAGGPAGGLELNGWIDELRVSKGIARWTANFTPPDRPMSMSARRLAASR